MTLRSGSCAAGISLFAWVILLGNCASPTSSTRIALKPGDSWREIAKSGGHPTVRFSYVMDGSKYDLVRMEKASEPLVFRNARLFKVLPTDAFTEFDREIESHLKTVGLPFENGMGGFHSWILAKSRENPVNTKEDPEAGGNLAETAAAAVILAPISPFLLAGGVCSITEHAMSGSERARGQAVNEALLASGPSYGSFLGQFKRCSFQTGDGSYKIHDYLATDGAFFTGRDYFYDVGFRDGTPLWVSYKNDAVRMHVIRYWNAHR